jgi:demethylmenaquinone methyltransferase/2-methoxy-6-polyprenyl-1,4-benzoquinol methylase
VRPGENPAGKIPAALTMPLYDFLAPAYDPAFRKIYLPFRQRALARLTVPAGARLLDLGCGTGQNFPLLASLLGHQGHLIGLDISSGMLRHARRRRSADGPRLSLIHADAVNLTAALLEAETGVAQVDVILCTFGFTCMPDPPAAFRASWNVLKPGGAYGILDIHADPRTLHARAVEWATRSRFTEAAWQPLREASPDFRMDYLDPSAHLFGGRLFVASGTKP